MGFNSNLDYEKRGSWDILIILWPTKSWSRTLKLRCARVSAYFVIHLHENCSLRRNKKILIERPKRETILNIKFLQKLHEYRPDFVKPQLRDKESTIQE